MLSTTISHYCYITARFLPPFHAEKSRIVWSKIEAVQDNADIEHNSVRACLQYLGIKEGVEIHHTGDLPARSGLGSSSAFTVGLLNCLLRMNGNVSEFGMLAREAIHVERDIMKENVGIQDQIACATGGFNYVTINNAGNFFASPIRHHNIHEIQKHCMLFFTGVSRTASDIAAAQIQTHILGNKDQELKAMQHMVEQALKIIESGSDICDFGHLLHESWLLKRSIAKNISPPFVDDIYQRGRNAGAIGGKLLGAGGGGMILLFAKPEHHETIKNELKGLLHVPFEFENEGAKIIFQS